MRLMVWKVDRNVVIVLKKWKQKRGRSLDSFSGANTSFVYSFDGYDRMHNCALEWKKKNIKKEFRLWKYSSFPSLSLSQRAGRNEIQSVGVRELAMLLSLNAEQLYCKHKYNKDILWNEWANKKKRREDVHRIRKCYARARNLSLNPDDRAAIG